ncbi:hypothetical protein [Proteus mirabilis]|uniref:hypothetical protein n=2 Tax=Proteus mirabilis TaxID=584 RepID=UPI001FAE2058|nr:hypothetical protein [Proteus mirabilis]MDC5972433.1 hypothetical protein [Proteus mirabilis]
MANPKVKEERLYWKNERSLNNDSGNNGRSIRFSTITNRVIMASCQIQDFRAKLKQWCETSVIAYVEKQELHDMLFHQVFHQSGNIHENRALQQLQTILMGRVENKTWQVLQPELTCTLIYHGMHAAVDNLEHSTEYTSQTLGALLYRQFTQLLS